MTELLLAGDSILMQDMRSAREERDQQRVSQTLSKIKKFAGSTQDEELPLSTETSSVADSSPSEQGLSLLQKLNRIKVSSPPRAENSFIVLQEWEGVVEEVGEKEFSALLVDVTAAKKLISERALFLVSDIGRSQRYRIRPGAVLRWLIGYQTDADGERQRFSKVVFRELPKITSRDRTQADELAREFGRMIAPLE